MTMKNHGLCQACRAKHTDGPLYKSSVDGNLYCIRHYGQMYKFGKIISIPKIHGTFRPNKAFKHDDYVELVLENQAKKEVARTIIDAEDYGKIVQFRWFMSRRGYVRTKYTRAGKTYRLRLHSFLLGKKDGFVTDHIDGDTLNNRKSNLRHVTATQSSWNSKLTTSYKVYRAIPKRKKDYKFMCNFQYKNQIIKLGKWDTREEALDIAKKFQEFLYGKHGYDASRSA